MTTTVTISLDAAINAVTCIQLQALQGIKLVAEAKEASDQDLDTIQDALTILQELEASQIELLAAIDKADEEVADD
jgi:hypothetical protein